MSNNTDKPGQEEMQAILDRFDDRKSRLEERETYEDREEQERLRQAYLKRRELDRERAARESVPKT